MTYNIIRNRGQANKATLENGAVVERQEYLFVPEFSTLVKCAEYDTHFIYETKDPGTAYKCTCGSPAVIAPPGPNGLFVCLFDLQNSLRGLHTTSFVNIKDVPKLQGSVIYTDGKRPKIRERKRH